ncbi:MAG TPA: hypothetical protein VMV69_17310 [Pirellulales bacterium]|nr:hypothetical protein [Pirellulales bacterium]
MAKQHSIEAIYDTHSAALQVVREFESRDFDTTQLSVASMAYQSDDLVVGCYCTTANHLKALGWFGGFWNELWGVLDGGALFVIPGIGPVLLGGPIVSTFLAVVDDPGGEGAGMLKTSIHRLGIPKNRVFACEDAIRTKKSLLLVTGTAEDLVNAKAILGAAVP